MARLLEIGITNAVIAMMLAIVVWAVTRRMRQPAFVHLLWVLVLVKLITPPLLPIPWSVGHATAMTNRLAAAPAALPAPPASPLPAELAPSDVVASAPVEIVEIAAKMPVAERPAASSPLPSIELTVWWGGLWLAGSAIWLLIAVSRMMQFHVALQHAKEPTVELQSMADDVAARLAVCRFRVRVTAGRLSPLVWPIGVPTIVVPQGLVDILTELELRAILTHEFAHLRRKDHWVRWLEFVAMALYWWNPVVWFVRRKIQQSEELACDAWVVGSNPATAKAYANALFQAVEVATDALRPAPVLASRVTSGGDLKERIEHVMNANRSAEMSKWWRRGLAFAALCILPLSITMVSAEERQERAPNEEDAAPKLAEPAQTVASSNNFEPTLQVAKLAPARHLVGELAKFRTVIRNTGNSALTNVVVLDSYDPAFKPRFMNRDCEVLSDGTLKWKINRLEIGERRVIDVQCECVSPSRGALSRVTIESDDGSRYSDERLVEVLQIDAVSPTAANNPPSIENVSTAESTMDENPAPPAWPAQIGRPPQSWNVTSHVQERQVISPEFDDAAVVGEQVKFLEQQFNQIDALYKSGAPGGTVDRQSMAGYELAKARGELALVEGNRAEATDQFAKAEEFAETALQGTDAAYRANRVTLDVLMQASNNLTDIRRRLIKLRRPPAAAPEGSATEDIQADLRRALAEQASSESSTASLAYHRKAMEQQKGNIDRLQALADKQVVSASELARAKAEYELLVEALRQTERKLESRKLMVQLAEVELAQAIEANTQAPGAISELEVRRKKVLVDLARAKVRELAE